MFQNENHELAFIVYQDNNLRFRDYHDLTDELGYDELCIVEKGDQLF